MKLYTEEQLKRAFEEFQYAPFPHNIGHPTWEEFLENEKPEPSASVTDDEIGELWKKYTREKKPIDCHNFIQGGKTVRDEMLKRSAPYLDRDKAIELGLKIFGESWVDAMPKLQEIYSESIKEEIIKFVDALLSSGTFREQPEGQQKHYNTKVVKGKDLKVGDMFWHKQEWNICTTSFIKNIQSDSLTSDSDFLVQLSPDNKEQ